MRDGEVGLGLGRLPQGTHGALEIAFGGQVEPMIAEPGGVSEARFVVPNKGKTMSRIVPAARARPEVALAGTNILGKNRLKKGPLPTSAAASSRN